MTMISSFPVMPSLPTPVKNSIPTGPNLNSVIRAAYHARIPFMLQGDHGVGKSESIAAVAKELGIGLISLNLAVMEPIDMNGFPKVDGDQVRYALPPWLLRVSTDAGGGFVLLDEVNRIQRYMVAPLHQMLTERAINGIQFHPAWLVCAAANVGAAYDVAELDPAFESRLLPIHVVASVTSWATWAAEAGLDQRVIDFVVSTPGIFASSSPRRWTMVSRLMGQEDALPPPLLATLVASLVGPSLATAFIESTTRQLLKPELVVGGAPSVAERMTKWRRQGDVAMLTGSSRMLQAYLQPHAVQDRLTKEQRRCVASFVRNLPAELRAQWNEWATKCGYFRLVVSKTRAV